MGRLNKGIEQMAHYVSLWLLVILSTITLYGFYIVRCEKKLEANEIGSITYHDRKNIATMVFLGSVLGSGLVCGVLSFIKTFNIYF